MFNVMKSYGLKGNLGPQFKSSVVVISALTPRGKKNDETLNLHENVLVYLKLNSVGSLSLHPDNRT